MVHAHRQLAQHQGTAVHRPQANPQIKIFRHQIHLAVIQIQLGALQPAAIGALYDVDPAQVKFFSVPSLNVVKISYPRHRPQGGVFERDMHGGQQFLPVLDLEL